MSEQLLWDIVNMSDEYTIVGERVPCARGISASRCRGSAGATPVARCTRCSTTRLASPTGTYSARLAGTSGHRAHCRTEAIPMASETVKCCRGLADTYAEAAALWARMEEAAKSDGND